MSQNENIPQKTTKRALDQKNIELEKEKLAELIATVLERSGVRESLPATSFPNSFLRENLNYNYPEAVYIRLEKILLDLRRTQAINAVELQKIKEKVFYLLQIIPVDHDLLVKMKSIFGNEAVTSRKVFTNKLSVEGINRLLKKYQQLLRDLTRYKEIFWRAEPRINLKKLGFYEAEERIRTYIRNLKLARAGSLKLEDRLTDAIWDYDEMEKKIEYWKNSFSDVLYPSLRQLNQKVIQNMASIFRDTEGFGLPFAVASVLGPALSSQNKFKKFLIDREGDTSLIYNFYDSVQRDIKTSVYTLQEWIDEINQIFFQSTYIETTEHPNLEPLEMRQNRDLGVLQLRQNKELENIYKNFVGLREISDALAANLARALHVATGPVEVRDKLLGLFIFTSNNNIQNYFQLKKIYANSLIAFADVIRKLFDSVVERNCVEKTRPELDTLREQVEQSLQIVQNHSDFIQNNVMFPHAEVGAGALDELDEIIKAMINLLRICQITVKTGVGEIGKNFLGFFSTSTPHQQR